MPFKSEAQRRLFHAKEERGEMPHKTVEEWEHATKNKKDLPYHKKKEAAFLSELEKIAGMSRIDPNVMGRVAKANQAARAMKRAPGDAAAERIRRGAEKARSRAQAASPTPTPTPTPTPSNGPAPKQKLKPTSLSKGLAIGGGVGLAAGVAMGGRKKEAAAKAAKKLKKVSMGMYC